MALIANLSIVLGANTQKAEKSLNRSASIVDKLTRSVAKLGAAFVGYVGVSRAIDGIGDSFERLDRLAKLSNALNLPVREMQAFALAAELAGRDAETIGRALAILQRRASEAKDGLTSAVRPLEQLGINIDKFNQMGTTEQFRTIADAMSDLTSQTDKARIANELFGRSGVELLPLLNGGAAALDSAADAIERYGAGVSDFDAAKIEQANDSWTRLGHAMNRIYDTLAIKLAPVVDATANLLIAATQKIADAIKVIGDLFQTTTGKVLAWAAATIAITQIVPLVVGSIGVLIKALGALKKAQQGVSAFSGPVGWLNLIVGAGAAAVAVWGTAEAMDELDKSFAAAQKQAEKFGNAGIMEGILADVEEMDSKFNDTFDSIRGGVNMMAEDFKQRADAMRLSLRTPLEEFQDKLEEIRELSSFLDPETVRRGVTSAVDAYTGLFKRAIPEAFLANTAGVERGSQGAFAAEFSKSVTEQLEVAEEIRDAELEGNRTLEEILAEMKRQPRIPPLGL